MECAGAVLYVDWRIPFHHTVISVIFRSINFFKVHAAVHRWDGSRAVNVFADGAVHLLRGLLGELPVVVSADVSELDAGAATEGICRGCTVVCIRFNRGKIAGVPCGHHVVFVFGRVARQTIENSGAFPAGKLQSAIFPEAKSCFRGERCGIAVRDFVPNPKQPNLRQENRFRIEQASTVISAGNAIIKDRQQDGQLPVFIPVFSGCYAEF